MAKNYKTAYSPLHKKYVGIESIRKDENGILIYYVRTTDGIKFIARECELTDFCL